MAERKRAAKKPRAKTEPKEETIALRKDLMDGMLVRPDGDARVYVMEGGRRRPFVGVDAFLACGFGWGQIQVLPPAEMEAIPIGREVAGPGDLNA